MPLSSNIFAQVMTDAQTVSDYLMITDEQQRIYVRRYLSANKNIAKECLEDVNVASATLKFNGWIENHPQYLRRNLTTAFTAALISECNSEKK